MTPEQQIQQLQTEVEELRRKISMLFFSDRYIFSRDIEMEDGRNVFIGKVWLILLNGLLSNALFANQTSIPLKGLQVNCNRWRTQASHFNMLQWTL